MKRRFPCHEFKEGGGRIKNKRPPPPLHVVPLYVKSSANTFVFFDKYLAKEKGERKNIQN